MNSLLSGRLLIFNTFLNDYLWGGGSIVVDIPPAFIAPSGRAFNKDTVGNGMQSDDETVLIAKPHHDHIADAPVMHVNCHAVFVPVYFEKLWSKVSYHSENVDVEEATRVVEVEHVDSG